MADTESSSHPTEELEGFKLGDRFEFEFCISDDHQRIFAELSGDHNPIHLDAEYARIHGYEGPVVYGGLIIGKISQLIGMMVPGRSGLWAGLKIDFHRPLYLNQTALLSSEVSHISAGTRSLMLKVRISTSGRLVAAGTAMTTLHSKHEQ
ncbi:MAG: (R)-hydratase [Rhodocyclales bacterium]|nr:(R)-hydratase [Rhodocyclales bacterium]